MSKEDLHMIAVALAVGVVCVVIAGFYTPDTYTTPRTAVAQQQWKAGDAAPVRESAREGCSYYTGERREAFEELRRRRDAGLLTASERLQANILIANYQTGLIGC